MTEKKRGGLSLPTGSAGQALQDLLKSEREPALREPATTAVTEHPSDPLPSTPTEIKLPSYEAVKEVSQEVVREAPKVRSSTHRKPPVQEATQEAWWEDVKTRAKAGGQDGRKVRLNVDVDEGVHLRMKLWCIKNGYKFNEMIPALMAAFLDEIGE